ncbi:uncharacterized protein LOC123870053 [Maniola jurtina]|uniref:uncharacterized protein LOC123870053 n=1 Tax=Maniola jurtina TaxID=191418 RepID=UPI001E68F76F|nr:uncharacterized protein LOC123870053 [Maniola jurtina]
MPPLDPLTVSNVVVNIFDTVTGTLVDGELKGIENCVFNKFQIDVQKKITTQHITCDIAIQGTIKLAGKNPAMQAVLGTSSVDAFGKGGFKMEKISLKFEAPFSLYKKDDGKIYLKVDDKAVKYLYNIKDAHFWADKITIGNEDISKIGVEYMNKNWRVIMESFGTLFVDTSIPMYFGLANQFYGAFPMNSYIIEDLSSYVK